MKFSSFFASLCLLLTVQFAFAQGESTPAAPAGELPYEELMKQAEEKLVPSGDGKIVFEGAAIVLFNRAQKVATDDTKKAEALLRMGETEMLLKAFPAATESFSEARQLKNLSKAQQARALFGYAHARHMAAKVANKLGALDKDIFAEYAAALAFAELGDARRIQAHEAVAELWTQQNKPLDAAREYEKIIALPAATDDQKKRSIGRALLALKTAPPSPEALKIINDLNQKLLPLGQTQPEYIKSINEWAVLSVRQNDHTSAIEIWNELATSDKVPNVARAEALRKISKTYRDLQKWDDALKAADRLSTLPEGTLPYQAMRLRERAATFRAQENEAAARKEWQQIAELAQIEAEEKAQAWQAIANSYKREQASALPKPNVGALIEGQKAALEEIWKTEGALRRTRALALIDRAQLDLDAKDTSSASTRLLDGLKVIEPWNDETGEVMAIKREFYLSLSTIYRIEKSYGKAIAALIGAQKFSSLGDSTAARAAIEVSVEAFQDQKWDETRTSLLALKNVWGLAPATYYLNIAQVEMNAKNWDAAQKALADFDVSNPAPEQKAEADKLRKEIPADTATAR